ISSTSAGDWASSSIWDAKRVPSTSDWVTVKHAVTWTSGDITCWTLHVSSAGSLTGNFSGTGSTHTIILTNKSYVDTAQFDTGIIVQGALTLTGKTKDAWLRMTTELSSNSTTVILSSTPVGWNVGDKIVIPDTRDGFSSVADFAPEIFTINSL